MFRVLGFFLLGGWGFGHVCMREKFSKLSVSMTKFTELQKVGGLKVKMESTFLARAACACKWRKCREVLGLGGLGGQNEAE